MNTLLSKFTSLRLPRLRPRPVTWAEGRDRQVAGRGAPGGAKQSQNLGLLRRQIIVHKPPRNDEKSMSLWNRKIPRSGFTLIEVLLVSVLFSICSVAIYNAFSSGIKLWAHAQRFAVEEDASIFFDKLSEDLSNSFYYSHIKFNGTATRLSSAAFVRTPADPRSSEFKEGLVDQMGAISYYFDYEERLIYRAQGNYAQALDGKFPDRRALVRAVDGLRFVYYLTDAKGTKPYASARDVMPSAVYVEVKYHDETSIRTMARFIPIPTGT